MMTTKKVRTLLLLLIFINGYVSLSLELIALRQVSSFVGSTAITASIVIGIFLAFMSWGYYYGSVIDLAKVSSRKLLYKSFVVITIMMIMAGSYMVMDAYFSAMSALGLKSNIAKTFVYSFLFLSLAPFLFGLNTAVICRFLHRYNRDYTGRIMAIDTVGSVLGSLLTTLILMPLIGVNHTIMLVVAVSLFGVFMVKQRVIDFLWFALTIAATYAINNDFVLYNQYRIVENNAVSTISIFDADEGKSKIMIMNGGNSSKYSKDKDLLFSYVGYIENTFVNTIPKDTKKDVLVLGAGGFTMGDDDEFHNYVYVDVDKSLLEVSEKYFLNKKLSKNREFVVQDANQFLKDTDKLYDLIILDTYSSLEFIPEDLITREYLQRVKDKLKPNGIVVMNIVSSPNFSDAFSRNFDNTVHFVFKRNIQRQVICGFNAWEEPENCNVIYAFYNRTNDGSIYTNNKNTLIYDMAKD